MGRGTLLNKLLTLIKKIQFHSPKKANIIIFDNVGSEFLIKYILFDLNYEIFYNRFEKIFISPKIIYYFIREIKKLIFRENLKISSKIYRSYILAFFDCVNPKITISFIDNNPIFDWISKEYINSQYYAIQNGIRIINSFYRLDKRTCNPESTSIKNMLCFGNNEADYYKKLGSCIENFHPVGSLKGSIYKYFPQENNRIIKYDLCLISQFRKNIICENADIEIKTAICLLNEYLNKFIKDTGTSLCIAFCSHDKEELDFYKKYFNTNFTVFPSNSELFSVYKAMDSSKVILSHHSTAAIEAFGWGKKVLMCNFCDNHMYDFDFIDLCTINIANYELFENKLKKLLNMDQDKYIKETKNIQKYMMNYDSNNPVNIYVRNLILNELSN